MATRSINALETQVSDARRTIASDGYPMSIGEITNLYRDGELIIRPEFQRFFRWSPTQKSRLVESLLLGIPLPSIFVSQQEEGKWELVDGLQRISTILEFQGELRDASGKPVPPLELVGTKYLPALEGRVWESSAKSRSLSPALRLDIKRSKLDIKIIKRESSTQAKYDLFQRLNSYGSIANAQEIRSALLVAVSPAFFAWVERLAQHPSFISTTQLGERDINERYNLELVLRFLVLHNRPMARLSQSALRDFSQFLDDEALALAKLYPRNTGRLSRTFKGTFDFISDHGGEDVFRRWDPERAQFRSSFLNTAFEVFGLGVGYHVANRSPIKSNLTTVVKEFWERQEMRSGFATGRSTEARMVTFIPLGREILAG